MYSLVLICLVVGSQAAWVKEMENPGLFEGDMILTPTQKKLAEKGKLGYALKIGGQWPKGVIPWEYGQATDYKTRQAIDAGIATLGRSTCLTFKKRTTERAYLTFFKGGGCYSYVGYSGGPMRISIGNNCEVSHIVVHEILHALGIYHEQSRMDRDRYITIHNENIQQGMESNFRKSSDTNSLGVEYDYYSIMHYASNAFSKNGRSTMTKKDGSTIARNTALTANDIRQINLYYKDQCRGGGGPRPTKGPRPPTRPTLPTRPPPPGGCRDTLVGTRCFRTFCDGGYWEKQCLKTCGKC